VTTAKPEIRYRLLKFCLEVAKPILQPVFWILDKIYDVFLRPGDLRRTRERNEQFGHEVQSSLPFLFTEHGGVLTPYPVKEPSPFDYGITRVVLPQFVLQFVTGHGDFQVRIAPKHAPDEMLDLSKLLSIIDKSFEDRRIRSFADLKPVLEPRMRLLEYVLGPDHYSEWRPWLPFASSQQEIKRRLDSDG
jgi:hypothetical protein